LRKKKADKTRQNRPAVFSCVGRPATLVEKTPHMSTPVAEAVVATEITPNKRAAEAGSPEEKESKRPDTQIYLDNHKIQQAVEEAIWAAVKSNAANPVAFIAAHLAGKASTYLEHANMTVPSIDAAVAFLRTVEPTFEVRHDETPKNSSRWCHIGTQSSYIALQARATPATPHRLDASSAWTLFALSNGLYLRSLALSAGAPRKL
jgi:hypothetical protein